MYKIIIGGDICPTKNDIDLFINGDDKALFGELLSDFPHTETEKLQRFYPDIHDTPGFFIGKLQKPLDKKMSAI